MISREKVDNKKERELITLCITNDTFLKKMIPIVTPAHFKTSMSRTVYNWCKDYFINYNKAPRGDIQDIYISHRSSIKEENDVDLISSFLQSISDSYEEPVENVDYLIKNMVHYLTGRNLENLKDIIEGAIQEKDYTLAERALAQYKEVAVHTMQSLDPINDDDDIISAFAMDEESLFKFSGAIGKVCGDFKRGDLIAFQAFSKVGKSNFLFYTADYAMRMGYNVTLVSLEMPKKQILRKQWLNWASRPRFKSTIQIPYFTKDEDDEKFVIAYHEKELEGFSPTEEWLEGWRKQFRQYFGKGAIRTVCFPSDSITVKGLMDHLENMEYYENYKTDILIIDYADLLHSDVKGEDRDKLNNIWINLRRYALEKNICIVTASQSGREASKEDSKAHNITGDIRKLAHATRLIAINGNKDERSRGIYRLEVLAEREGSIVNDQAVVLHCLDIGKCCLDSRFLHEVQLNKSEEDEEEKHKYKKKGG